MFSVGFDAEFNKFRICTALSMTGWRPCEVMLLVETKVDADVKQKKNRRKRARNMQFLV
jgi:hypothetical protein